MKKALLLSLLITLFFLANNSFAQRTQKPVLHAKHWMAITGKPLGASAGAKIFNQGGNAVDAACASALALGVCEPQASGIGGQSLAILHINGKTVAVDGSSRAPSLAHISFFTKHSMGQ